MSSRVVVVLALVAGGAWLYLRQRGPSSPSSAGASPDGEEDARGVRVGLAPGGLGAALAPLAALGPVGAGVAVAGGLSDAYQQASPEQKQQLQGTANKIKRTILRTDPLAGNFMKLAGHKDSLTAARKKRNDVRNVVDALDAETSAAEDYGRAVYSALSDPSTEWWKADASGVYVKQRGQRGAFLLKPTGRGGTPPVNPTAWIAEPFVRLFGSFQQSGYGPVRGAYRELETGPGFSEDNPYAPTTYRPSRLAADKARLEGIAARKVS